MSVQPDAREARQSPMAAHLGGLLPRGIEDYEPPRKASLVCGHCFLQAKRVLAGEEQPHVVLVRVVRNVGKGEHSNEVGTDHFSMNCSALKT